MIPALAEFVYFWSIKIRLKPKKLFDPVPPSEEGGKSLEEAIHFLHRLSSKGR